MMSVKKVFSIQIKSEYYKTGFSDDFDILPDESSKLFFNRYNLKFLKSENCFDLFWLVKNIKDVDKCYKELFQNVILKFSIQVKNTNVFNFSQIKPNRIYNFENNFNNNFLHKSRYVSDENITQYADYMHKIFGFITIDMRKIIYDNEALTYCINIPTIESLWQVNFFDNDNKIESVNDFLLNKKKYNFTNIGTGKNLIFISEQQIPLKEVGLNSLTVSYTTKDAKKIKVPIPCPNYYDKLSKNGQYISEIYYSI